MKITKRQLRKIIREERTRLTEGYQEESFEAGRSMLNGIVSELSRNFEASELAAGADTAEQMGDEVLASVLGRAAAKAGEYRHSSRNQSHEELMASIRSRMPTR